MTTPRRISRREFLTLAAAGFVAGCSPPQQTVVPPAAQPPVQPTSQRTIEPTTTPTATPAPTLPPTPITEVRRPDIIQIYPDAPSKVVRARHAEVWNGEELSPEVLRQMLDASVAALTSLDAAEAWSALFAPEERIAIKVNSITEDSSHIPLVMAVAGCLQEEAGLPAEHIVIFDRYTLELESAGYTINKDGPGVRCRGSDMDYTSGWMLADTDVMLSDVLLECDGLINVPMLKVAPDAGISFAMKNHYGTFDTPSLFHGSRFERGVTELNALPPIKERARLIIGDLLTANTHRERIGYRIVGVGDALLVSFDPVAHDTIGLQMASEVLTAEGQATTAMTNRASPWLASGSGLGLGTNDPANIELVEVNLG